MVNQDILSEALRDYIAGQRNVTFVQRDDGYKDVEPIERYFKGYNEWIDVEKKLFDSRIKGRVLEIGCNIGEHIRFLQEMGFYATGIDISRGAVELAKERGVNNVYLMDARKMTFESGSFDTVLILYYGFGLGGIIEDQKNMLKDIHRMTTHNSQIICSSIDALRTDRPVHIEYQNYNKERGKPYGNITQVSLRLQHKDKLGDWYNLLFINPEGAMEIVKGTGWKVSETIPEKVGGRAWYYVLTK